MSQPLRLQNPFVGRAREQKAYQQLLAQDSPWLLVITGDGGIGKSRLLRHLLGQTPRDIPAALLNFANDKLRIDPLNILEELSYKIAAHCDEKRVAAFEQVLTEGRDKLSEAIKAIHQQFIAGGGANVTGVQQDLTGYSAATMREQRRQVRESLTRAFYNQLMTFQPAQLALMLDTCEWLSELEGLEVGKWVMDELLPAIHERLAHIRRRLSVVIAGRVLPPLTVIEKHDLWSLSLPRLDSEAVNLYLQQIGMQDTTMRQRVYEITQGHALCVSIIGTLWQEQGDHPFTLADLPHLRARFTEKALVEYIRERLAERLKAPYRDLTRYGVLLRSFDLPMLQVVFPELLSGPDALDIFHQLTAYPYVERRGNSHFAFHDLLREIQAAEVRAQQPAQWNMYHQRALDYLAKQSPRPADWYYHTIACDEEQGMNEWWEAVQDVLNFGTYEGCNTLLEVVFDVVLQLTTNARAMCAFQQGNLYSHQKLMDAALLSYQEALLFSQLAGNQLIMGNTLVEIGEVQRFRKEMNEALASYEQALGLYRKMGSKLGEANVLQSMGSVRQFRDERDEALALYQQALALYRQVGDRLGEANVLQSMGSVQRLHKEMDKALALYEQALELYRQVDSKLGEANCYLEQGRVALKQEDYQYSLDLHNKAYFLYQQIKSQYNQALLLYYRSFVREAMLEQQQAIQDAEQALAISQPLNLPWSDLYRERLEELREQPHK